MQRSLDIVLSAFAIIVLSPLLLPLIALLRATGEGEVFFLQRRVGKGGETFNLYKFATMLKDSPNLGTGTVTIKNDPRVLPVGRFLRQTKINELPQLINIFSGDMSIIGPRPQTERCFKAFPLASQKQILKVKPGLSGLGSIAFRREEDMISDVGDPDKFYDDVVMPYKGRLEEWYVSNRNLRSYFAIIFLTIWVVLFPHSRLIWTLFRDLPEPPPALHVFLCYPQASRTV